MTALLSTRFPELMPDVIAIDPSSGMMLTGEFHGRPLSETDDLACWRRAYASLGHVQRQLSGSIEDLREVGVPVRDLDSLRIQIPALLRDRRRMRIGMDRGITEREAGRLLAAEPRLIEVCSRLASGPIPLSLDHGDFWPGNIYSGPDRVTLFDWSDATITHPFFSLVMARDEIEAALNSVPGAGQLVVAAYLAGWTGYASFTELEAIFEDAMLVAPLHQAAMYRTTYLPAMEFVEELDRMTPHFLRWLAARL
ncbi:MAG: aminoglycoside phosphotransferase family protein [Thermomicrobiales bacterium]